MADVFISFVHEEEEVAKAVQSLLGTTLKGKAEVFLSADTWQIHAGELWLDRITEELKGATVVILMLSPISVARPWVNFEAGGAFFMSKKIIPACFGGLTKAGMPKPYSNFQAVHLETADDPYYLVRSVCHHLGVLHPPPPPPPQFKVKLTPELQSWFQQYDRLRTALDNYNSKVKGLAGTY